MFELEMNADFKKILSTELENVSAVAPICPFIFGDPGIGKSSIVKAMCEEKGWHYFELLCNQLGDRADLTGCRTVQETDPDTNETIWKQVFFPHQAIQDAITCANKNPDDLVVILLDEVNRTTSDITSAALSFITARKIGSVTFPDNIRFIVAGNDKGNISALDTASISRFAKYKIKPSAQAYMDFEDQLNPYIKAVLDKNKNLIFCTTSNMKTSIVEDEDGSTYENEYEAFDDMAEGFDQITTPRTISGLNAFLNACDFDTLKYYVSSISRDAETGEETSLLQAIIEGHCGDTEFTSKLVEEIATAINNGAIQKATMLKKPVKTKLYKDIMKCTDRQTRDTMIQSLTNDEKSSILLYAIWEKGVDNSDLINTIAKNYTAPLLAGAYQQEFSALKTHDELDTDNYTALISSGTTLGTMMRQILGD